MHSKTLVAAAAAAFLLAGSTMAAPQTGSELEAKKAYNAKIRQKIAANKGTSDDGAYCKCRVVTSFKISASGQLTKVKLVESSGWANLDLMAVESLQRAAPFPPTPDGKDATYTISFKFHGDTR